MGQKSDPHLFGFHAVNTPLAFCLDDINSLLSFHGRRIFHLCSHLIHYCCSTYNIPPRERTENLAGSHLVNYMLQCRGTAGWVSPRLSQLICYIAFKFILLPVLGLLCLAFHRVTYSLIYMSLSCPIAFG